MSKKSIFNTSADLNFPDIEPSLYLNFIASQKVPSFVNVTRNSQTTYVDKFGILRTADINQPVFEWDPITGKCLGARIWGSVTNLAARSQEFENASWAKSAASVNSNVILAPNGALTGDALVDTTANSGHSLAETLSVSSSTTYTFSCFVKKGSQNFALLNLGPNASWSNGTTTTRVFFDLVNGTVASSAQATGQIFAYPNGWYRCIATATTTASATSALFGVQSASSSSSASYAGNADEAIYVWGAQVNTGSVAGPYVPTTSTSASSTADVWTITGADAARVINQSEGTVYAETQINPAQNVSGTFRHIIQATPAANNDSQIALFVSSSNQYQMRIRDDGGAIQSTISTGLNTGAVGRAAGAYKVSDFAVSANGAAPGTSASGNAPTTAAITQMVIGGVRDSNALQAFNGYIRTLAIWPKRLPNSTLVSMTS